MVWSGPYSFNKYMYENHVIGIFLNTRKPALKNIDFNPCSHGVYSPVMEADSEQINR
jgi:hypothetical protein